MKTFKEYCKQRDQQLEEGLGSWMGGIADKATAMGAKGIGRMGNAAISGLGHGIMQGAQRGWNALTQGQGSNQAHQLGLMAQKAAMSGDPDQFKVAANTIYKQMKQMKQGAAMMQQPAANQSRTMNQTAAGNTAMQPQQPQMA